MPWFKISDDWLDHPKVQRAGKNGRALWVAVGNRCAKYSSDGLIEGDLVKSIAALAEVPAAATTKKLVELELWHSHETLKKCNACVRDIDTINSHRRTDGLEPLRVRPGDYYFHDWAAHQLSKRRTLSTEARMAEDRARALRKDPNLCRDIQARDRGLCRYCGRRVNWSDRRGPARATYDHIDPFCFTPNGGNFLEGVVVACGPCNSDKGQRTADEWEAAGGPSLKAPGWQPNRPKNAHESSAKNGAENAQETAQNSGAKNERENAPTSEAPDDEAAGHSAAGSSPDLTPDLAQPGPEAEKPDSGPDSPHAHGRLGAGLGPGQVGLGPGSGPGQVRAGAGGLGLGGVGAGLGLAGLVRAGPGAPPGVAPSPPTDESDGSTSPTTDGGMP